MANTTTLAAGLWLLVLVTSFGPARAQQCLTGLSCSECPGCVGNATCAANPVVLPPKSDFWPPEDILQRPYGPGPVIAADLAAELEWFQTTVLDVLPSVTKQADTEYALTDKEEMLVKMSLTEWQAARAAGTYTCEEIATALTKRATYMQAVQKMNSFMYWDSFDWIKMVLAQAKALDAAATAQGVDVIAPLYCYPVPLKGTMATKDFPSSLGFAALHDKVALKNADLVTLIKEANGVLFGKTNVPELAHSW
jgi:Amidase